MKGLENPGYLAGWIFFTILALLFVLAAVRRPRLARLLFFILFSWACVMNWSISQRNPAAYQEYAIYTFSSFYRDFIRNWFQDYTKPSVGFIATCQGLIAIAMLLRGWVYKIGAIGAIVFLLAIAPLGVGSGFPCTIIFALAMILIYNKSTNYLWSSHPTVKAYAT